MGRKNIFSSGKITQSKVIYEIPQGHLDIRRSKAEWFLEWPPVMDKM